MPSVQTMEDLFHEGLKDIYYAEKEILKALDKTMKKTASKELKDALMTHRSQTEGQVERLEKVFQTIEQKPRGKTCQGIRGIIEEGKEQMEEIADEMVRDAAIIGAAQSIEHYEITRYGTLAEWARQLGNDRAANLLDETLEEEKQTDALLSELAQIVNEKAEKQTAEGDDGESLRSGRNASRSKSRRVKA